MIRIGKVEGNDNQFLIDLQADREKGERINAILDEKTHLKEHRGKLADQLENARRQVSRNKAGAEQLAKKIRAEKDAGRRPPDVYVEEYRKFLRLMREVETLEDELDSNENRLRALDDEIMVMQQSLFDALIINENEDWGDYNKIRFKLIDPPREVVYVPSPGVRAKMFKLRQDEEGNYRILPVEENGGEVEGLDQPEVVEEEPKEVGDEADTKGVNSDNNDNESNTESSKKE